MKMHELLPAVQEYLDHPDPQLDCPWDVNQPLKVFSLAQGEYNLNYLVQQFDKRWVLRVNIGTQIDRDDQIRYEYRALRLLQDPQVTPRPYFVDDSLRHLPYGVLLMEFLPGGRLDYQRDLTSVANLFARVHRLPVDPAHNHLIHEESPLSMTYQECAALLDVYFRSELADPAIRDYLSDILSWASEARFRETFFLADPCPCIINTEVNSGNFIANREAGTLHLVDWEKPLWGDPSQDLSHFCVPTTTLWKTEYRLSSSERRVFLDAYRTAIRDPHLRATIEERVRLRDPFNCLRGVSWSAMAWVTYQTGDHTIRNPDTFRKINQYLQLGFLKSLFAPYIPARINRLWNASSSIVTTPGG